MRLDQLYFKLVECPDDEPRLELGSREQPQMWYCIINARVRKNIAHVARVTPWFRTISDLFSWIARAKWERIGAIYTIGSLYESP